MPFGLTNAPATFQDYISKILVEKLDIFIILYLDDILMYHENGGEKHVGAVWWILEQLQKHLWYANLKKYWFYQDELRFLDYILSHQGIQIEEKQIKTICNWPEPQSIYNIQVFLGFIHFHRQFIQGLNNRATPLISTLKISVVGLGNENLEQDGQRI